MQTNKILALTTEIYNKLGSKTFISNTCPKHTSYLPLYYCEGCFHNIKKSYCEQCFRQHECENKVKVQISIKVSSEQQRISKSINSVIREFQTNKQSLHTCKVQLKKGQNSTWLTVGQINRNILMNMTKCLGEVKDQLQEKLLKPLIQKVLFNSTQTFMKEIQLKTSEISNKLEDIILFADECERICRRTQQNLSVQNRKMLAQYKQDYIRKITSLFKKELENLLDGVNNSFSNQKEAQYQWGSREVQEKDKQIQNYQKQIRVLEQKMSHYKNVECQLQKQKNLNMSLAEKIDITKQEYQKVKRQLQEKVVNMKQKQSELKVLQIRYESTEKNLRQLTESRSNAELKQEKRTDFLLNEVNRLNQMLKLYFDKISAKQEEVIELKRKINDLEGIQKKSSFQVSNTQSNPSFGLTPNLSSPERKTQMDQLKKQIRELQLNSSSKRQKKLQISPRKIN